MAARQRPSPPSHPHITNRWARHHRAQLERAGPRCPHVWARRPNFTLKLPSSSTRPPRTHDELLEAIAELVDEQPGLVAQHFPVVNGSWSKGWPDLEIIGPGGVLWREVKTARGRLEPAQWRWGQLLLAAGQDWAVWGPADYPETIREQLTQLAQIGNRNSPSGV